MIMKWYHNKWQFRYEMPAPDLYELEGVDISKILLI